MRRRLGRLVTRAPRESRSGVRTGVTTGLVAGLVGAALALGGLPAAGAAPTPMAPAPADPTPGAPGAGDPYFPWDGNGGYDVRHYGIHNTLHLSSGLMTGWTRIDADATQDLSRFNLDFLLRIERVRVNGKRATFSRTGRKEVTVRPRQPIADGEPFVVHVKYRGHPGRIVWKDGDFFANKHEALAVNQPHIAGWWFPANDHPRDTARFDVHLKVPRGNQVISNGRQVGVKRGAAWTTYHWQSKQRMATYLAFFAAGKFRIERGRFSDGTRYVYAVSRRLSANRERAALRLLRKTAPVHRWLESWIGDYPFRQSGGVVTSLGLWFALENQTRPVYPALGPSADELVAHEVAHQWFGDSLAVDSWRDIWLNEGWATWFETMWQHRGDSSTAQQRLRAAWSSQRPGSGFWDLRISDPGADNLFADAVYERGGMTIQALRHRIGESDFKKLVRTWVTRYRNRNVTTEMFTDLAEEVSGEDLDSFFDAWLRDRTRPADTAENGLR